MVQKTLNRSVNRLTTSWTKLYEVIQLTGTWSNKSLSSIPQCLKGKIRKTLHLGHQNPLQADQDHPIYALRHIFRLVSPSGVKYGFKVYGIQIWFSRRSNKIAQNYLFKVNIEEGLLKFKQRLKARGYPENIIVGKVPVRGQLCLQTIGPYKYTRRCVHSDCVALGSHYITGDERGKKKRPKYEWSAGKQI